MINIEEELNQVKDADDNLFPEWLFNPVYNDFGDNYYSRSFAEDELTTIIKKLRRRYNDFFEWAEAIEMYNEYMDKMIEKYGSIRVIKNALEVDMMEDPIPSKPKLKNNRKNRQFLRTGIAPSRKIVDVVIPDEEMLAIARQAFPDTMGETIDEADSLKKLPKEQAKRLKEIQQNLAGRSRRDNLYRSVGNNRGTDFIVEYLNQAKRGVYSSSGIKEETENQSLVDIMEEMDRIADTRPELLEDETESQTTYKNGRLVRKSDEIRMQILEELYKEGIDIFGNMTKNMDKKSVKMVRSRIGATEPMTKKELKKHKKRNKKEQARIQRRRDANSILEETLLGNKLDVHTDSNGNLNLRLRDLFRDD